MAKTVTGTWNDDPAHFRRPTRRNFLHVGLAGGARTDAGSVLPPGGARRRQAGRQAGPRAIAYSYFPAWRHRPSGHLRSKAARSDRVSRRTGHDHAPSSTACSSTSCSRTPPQLADKITVCRSMTHGEAAHERGTHNMFTGYRPSPALTFPSMGSVVSHEFGPRNNLPPYVCVPSHADHLRRSRLSLLGVCALQSRQRPGQPRLLAFRICSLPGGVDEKRFTSAPHHARSGQRPLRRQGKGRRPGGDGHLLPAGLQPHQLARRRARRSTSTPRSRPSATSTAATPPVSACCWRGGSSPPECVSCR